MLFETDPYIGCPCGSGQKYKFCCRPKDREADEEARRRGIADAVTIRFGRHALTRSAGEFLAMFEEIDRAERETLDGHPAQARERVQRILARVPFHTLARHALALTYYEEGDFARAIEIIEELLADVEPGNLPALSMLVHVYLILGRRAEAERIAERARSTVPPDSHSAMKRCEVLARMLWHEEVVAAFKAGRRLLQAEDVGRCAFWAGTACANLERRDEAAGLLELAADDPSVGARARRYIEWIRSGQAPKTIEHDWPYFAPRDWLPRSVLERQADERTDIGWMRAHAWPGLVEVVRRLVEERPEEAVPAIGMLELLATGEAVALLTKLAFGVFGPDEARLRAAAALLHLGAIECGRPLHLFLRGEWHEARHAWAWTDALWRLWGDVPTVGLSRDLLVALDRGELEDAVRVGRKALEAAPGDPAAPVNLAVALLRRGERAEAEALLGRAPATLAVLRLSDGRLNEAEALLAEPADPAKVDPWDLAWLRAVQGLVAFRRGRAEEAFDALDASENLEPGVSAPARLRGVLEELGIAAASAPILDELERRRRERRLRRPWPADAMLGDILAVRTRADLVRASRLLEVPATHAGSLAALVGAVRARLTDRAALGQIVAAVAEDRRACLRQVLSTRGIAPYMDLACPPGSPCVDDLRDRVLVAEGTVDGMRSVLVPRELRPLLAEILRTAAQSRPV